MKKLFSVVLACLIILLVGCSNEKAVKEAATNEFNNETSFPAGNTEAEKPQESEIVESSVQVTEKERENTQSIGLSLDSTATECWDNPITANPRQKNIKGDIQSRLNRYKNVEGFTAVWVWAEKVTDTEYEIYIGYC